MQEALLAEDAAVDRPSDPALAHRQGRAGWTAVASLSLGVFALATAEFLPATLLTPIAAGLGVSEGAAGQAVTVTAAVAAIAGPALVIATRRIDRRRVVWGLSLLLILSDLVAAVAPDLPVLLAARALLGIGLGGMGAFVASLCQRLVPANRMSRAMALVFTGMTAASILAPTFGVALGRLWGWRATFLAAAAIGLLALLVQLASLRPMPPTEAAGIAAFGRTLRRPGIRTFLAVGMLAICGYFAGFTYARPFMEQVSRFDVGTMSAAFLALGIGGFVGNLAGGLLAGRSARLSAALATLILAAAALILLLYGASSGAVLAAMAIWGIGFGATPISIQTLLVEAAPDHAESVGALMMSTLQVAIAAGAVIGGILVDALGTRGALGFGALAALAACILLAGARRRSV